MSVLIRLVGGFLVLGFVTFCTVGAGIGGFFFSLGVLAVIFFAFSD